MEIVTLDNRPTSDLARALESFELAFQYPLGESASFSISHGQDYSRFFRAMGPGASIIALEKGAVLGTIGVSLRRLQDSQGQIKAAVYIGDLKVLPQSRRSGRVTLALLKAAYSWARQKGAVCGYGVVMGGTARTPEQYTGRLEIPLVSALGQLDILRIDAGATAMSQAEAQSYVVSRSRLNRQFQGLCRGSATAFGANHGLRSRSKPLPLASQDGDACGLLEDTLLAKRLIDNSGREILSAHLSLFAFDQSSPQSASQLIEAALVFSRERGFPALFVAVDHGRYQELAHALAHLKPDISPAFVYGVGLPETHGWTINTAEI